MSIRINNKIISGTYTSQSYRYVGEIFQSALPIDDSRVALLDGHTIYISEGHGSFIQYLNSLIALYPQLACTEDEWQSCNTTYGECGKFVVTDDSVRLPKIVSFVQGLSSLQDLATLVEAGLPNITGSIKTIPAQTTNLNDSYGSGAFGNTKTSPDKYCNSGGSSQPTTTPLFDASLSNPIYGNSPTVQPQSIRYPYYIVLATGVTQEVKTKEELTTNNPFTLFESKYSEVDLNNTSWLLSNGQWNSKELYPSAYNELLKEYNTPTNKYSIKLYTDEYTDYDFVLNLDDETFRLPLLDGSESLVGDRYDELELLASGSTYIAPANGYVSIKRDTQVAINNETLNDMSSWSTGESGALFLPVRKNDVFRVSYYEGTGYYFRFYYAQGNGSLYFYVGETNINTNLVDTGKLTQEVANLIPNNSGLISGFGMPTSKYIDLTLGASATTYIAPANGYVFVQGTGMSSGLSYIGIGVYSGDDHAMWDYYVDNIVGVNTNFSIMTPVLKGRKYFVGYNTSVGKFRFIYAEGEK